jgi:hypothetical protein
LHTLYLSLNGIGLTIFITVGFFTIYNVFSQVDKVNHFVKYKPKPVYREFYDKKIMKIEDAVYNDIISKITKNNNLIITKHEVHQLMDSAVYKEMWTMYEYSVISKRNQCFVNSLNIKYFHNLSHNTFIVKLLSQPFNVRYDNPNLALDDEDYLFLQISHFRSVTSLCKNPSTQMYNINTINNDLSSLLSLHQKKMYIDDLLVIYNQIHISNNISTKAILKNLPSKNKVLEKVTKPISFGTFHIINNNNNISTNYLPEVKTGQIDSSTNNGYKY